MPGNHQFLVGLHYPDVYWAGFLGNDRSMLLIQVHVQMDAEEFQVDPGKFFEP